MLIDDGYLVREDDRWVAAGDLSEVKVPPTVQALIAARLDRLAPLERAVLERAAIIGKVFAAASIRSLANEELSGNVDEGIRALLRKDLIRPDRGDLGEEDCLSVPASAGPGCRVRRDAEGAPGAICTKGSPTGSSARPGPPGELDEFVGYHLEQSYRYREELGSCRRRTDARSPRGRACACSRRESERWDAATSRPPSASCGRAMALLPADDPRALSAMPCPRTSAVLRRPARARLGVPRRGGRPSGGSGRRDDRRPRRHPSRAGPHPPRPGGSDAAGAHGDREPHGDVGGRGR